MDINLTLAYRQQAFTIEAKRMEYLFELYEQYTAGLFAVEGKKGQEVIRLSSEKYYNS